MKTKSHIYTHLGKAPYALVGYEYCPRVETAQGFMGGNYACDHCGRGIAHVFFIRSADGKEFTLGSEHANHLGDDGLVANIKAKMADLRRKARDQANREWNLARAKKQADDRSEAISKIKAEFAKIADNLKKTPHPNTYFASQGKTMIDYLDYFRADVSKPVLDQEDDWWFYNPKVRLTIRGAGGDV